MRFRSSATRGDRDVSSAFQPDPTGNNALVGLVAGLVNGKNTLAVRTKAGGPPDASIEITNYPISGPVFSGPWITPFVCQTDVFKLPDGTTLLLDEPEMALSVSNQHRILKIHHPIFIKW
jgi:hypothetical protein